MEEDPKGLLEPDQDLGLIGCFENGRILYVRNQINDLLSTKTLNQRNIKFAIREYLLIIKHLRASGFSAMQTLANTLDSWQEEILRMLRFTRNNGITEGFHNKMELISRRAYGFRNFENYRQRVLLQCA